MRTKYQDYGGQQNKVQQKPSNLSIDNKSKTQNMRTIDNENGPSNGSNVASPVKINPVHNRP